MKIDAYTLVDSDFNYNNSDAGSHTGGTWDTVSGASRVARAEDTAIHFFVDSACVDTTGLVNGDVLEVSMPVTDGTSDVGDFHPYWSVKNDQGMSNGPGTNGTVYTFAGVPSGSTLSVNAGKDITTPVAGKTYTFQDYKVVKQGSTTNLLTNCGTTGATGTVALDTGASHRLSAWTDIPSGAKRLVVVRPLGSGGNGSTSPAFTGIGFCVRA